MIQRFLKCTLNFVALAFCLAFIAGAGPCDKLKNWFGCSSCDGHSKKHAHQQSSSVDADDKKVDSKQKHANQISFELSDEEKKGLDKDEIIARFPSTKVYNFSISLIDEAELGADSINDEISGVMPTFDFRSIPANQKGDVANEIFKSVCLRRELLQSYMQDPAFADKIKNTFRSLLRILTTQKVGEELMNNAVVSEDDMLAEYNQNKMRYLLQVGGVRTLTASFTSEESAESFKASLEEKEDISEQIFSDEAKQKGADVRDYDYISKEITRGASKDLIEAVSEFDGEFPALTTVSTGNNEFLVALVTDSREPKFKTFEEAKKEIEMSLKRVKVMNSYNKAMGDFVKKAQGELLLKPQINLKDIMTRANAEDLEDSDIDDLSLEDLDSDEELAMKTDQSQEAATTIV